MPDTRLYFMYLDLALSAFWDLILVPSSTAPDCIWVGYFTYFAAMTTKALSQMSRIRVQLMYRK